jgi:predicted NBD/HSP70 family sugar kinase
MASTIGIDIGGSSVEAVTRSEAAEITGRYHASNRLQGGAQVAASAVAAFHALDSSDSVAVGVGIPGHVDPLTGQVRLAVNLGIGTEAFDLASSIAEQVGLPVIVENDVRAAALGAYEMLSLGGNRPDSLAVVSIGTGISAGVVVDGALLRGSHGMAGEIGHVVVDESGPVCRCGQRGCLETVAAGPAIARAWPGGDPDVAATALFAAAASGDPAAQKVAARITGHITTALTWLAAAYDTEAVVLAGGVASVGADFLTVIRRQLIERAAASDLAARRLQPDQVVLADRFDPPGPRGAALIASGNSLRERVSPAGKQASNRK